MTGRNGGESRPAASSRGSLAWTVAAGLLMALAVAVRLYGAWAARHITDPDSGVVALMVKHIAEGGPWPVFFYGQAYMGTLEPLFSAGLAALIGVRGLAVTLGTALPAALSLPLIYALGRGAGGRAGGLAALGMCLIGPEAYFSFQYTPRGGYTAMLLAGGLAMGLTCRMAPRLWRREAVSGGWFFALGLTAGLGWWTDALITATLLACAAVLAVAARGRVLSLNALAGLPGFVAGSLPFWWWNAANQWASFATNEGCRFYPPRELLLNLADKFYKFNGFAYRSAFVCVALSALYALPAAGAVAVALAQLGRRRPLPHGFWYAACAGLTVAFHVALYALSSYARMNTSRYLIPLAPAVAVLTGFAAGPICPGTVRRAVGAAVALLALAQCPFVAHLHERAASVPRLRREDAQLAEFLDARRIGAVYSHFRYYAKNFTVGERFRFTGLIGERHAPLALAAERTDRPAFLDDFGQVSDFLKMSGGRARVERCGRFALTFDFIAPRGGLAEIEPARWLSVVDKEREEHGALLSDRDLDTAWRGVANPDAGEWLEISFRQPETVRMLRLISGNPAAYPRAMRVLGRATPDGEWFALCGEHRVTSFYWSGPRPFWRGRRERLEYRFGDPRLQAIRIVSVKPPVGGVPWTLREIQCFAPGEDGPSEAESFVELEQVLRSRRRFDVYCDRWVASRLHAADPAAWNVELPKHLAHGDVRPSKESIAWSPQTAVVVRRHDAPATRDTLARHRVGMRETPVGAWTLFDFDPDGPQVECAANGPPVYWTGYHCLTGNARRPAMRRMAAALERMRAQDAEQALRHVCAAAALYPDALTVSSNLLAWLRAKSPEAAAPLEAARLERVPRPPEIRVEFQDGICLEGVSVEPRVVTRGGRLRLTGFWRGFTSRNAAAWVAFVHFERNGKPIFQDDHHLLADALVADRSNELDAREVVREERTIRVPADAPAGDYSLTIGLYNAVTGARSAVKTDAPARRRAVLAPLQITVRP